jgi:hypothetical protein
LPLHVARHTHFVDERDREIRLGELRLRPRPRTQLRRRRTEVDVQRERHPVDIRRHETARDRQHFGVRDAAAQERILDRYRAWRRLCRLDGSQRDDTEVAVECEDERVGDDVATDHAVNAATVGIECSGRNNLRGLRTLDGQRAEVPAQDLGEVARLLGVGLVEKVRAFADPSARFFDDVLIDDRDVRVRIDREDVGPFAVDQRGNEE